MSHQVALAPKERPMHEHQQRSMPAHCSSAADSAILAAFHGLADLADANPASLASFSCVLHALSCKQPNLNQLESLLSPEVCAFGTACMQHACLLDAAVLHHLLQLGRGGDDGRLRKAQLLKEAASQQYSSSSCSSSCSLRQVLQKHLAAQAAVASPEGCNMHGSSASQGSCSSLQQLLLAGDAAPVGKAMAALGKANRSVRMELVRWFGGPEPDIKRGMQGAQLLQVLPAVAVLDDLVVCKLLRVGEATINAEGGIRALRQYADEYIAHCGTKYANTGTAVVVVPPAKTHWCQLLIQCVFYQG